MAHLGMIEISSYHYTLCLFGLYYCPVMRNSNYFLTCVLYSRVECTVMARLLKDGKNAFLLEGFSKLVC